MADRAECAVHKAAPQRRCAPAELRGPFSRARRNDLQGSELEAGWAHRRRTKKPAMRLLRRTHRQEVRATREHAEGCCGGEKATGFKMALHAGTVRHNIGFKLFECVIYRKHGSEGAWWKMRFRVDHEYMPIFLKGDRPQYFEKEPLKVPSKHGGKTMTGSGARRTDGGTNPTVRRQINTMKCRGTIWNYLMAGDKNPDKRKHPAPFPDQIPMDFIQCFCPPHGIVLDPFLGCGSTAVAAKQLGRNFIGFEIAKEYCNLAEVRIRKTHDAFCSIKNGESPQK